MDDREQWGGYGGQQSQGYGYDSSPNQNSCSRSGGLNHDYYQGQGYQSEYQGGPQSYGGSDGQSMDPRSFNDRDITDPFDDPDGQLQDEQQQDSSPEGFVGNFSLSSEQVTLDEDYNLVALCRNGDGEVNEARISLNDCLTNDGGRLRWARGGNFGDTAQDVRLDDGGKILVATLGDGEGGWTENSIQLDERITNDNGALVFVD